MTTIPFLHGAGLALGLILPIGPQNLFILQQGALQPCWKRVAPAILAAGIADTVMIAIAVSGAGTLLPTGATAQQILLIAGIVFLAWMGLSQWRAKAAVALDSAASVSTARQVGSALAVSVLNPHAILDFVAVIGPSSLSYQGIERWLFACGCIANSWVWFPLLACAGHCACRFLASERSRRISGRASALILWICAGYLAVSLSRTAGLAALPGLVVLP